MLGCSISGYTNGIQPSSLVKTGDSGTTGMLVPDSPYSQLARSNCPPNAPHISLNSWVNQLHNPVSGYVSRNLCDGGSPPAFGGSIVRNAFWVDSWLARCWVLCHDADSTLDETACLGLKPSAGKGISIQKCQPTKPKEEKTPANKNTRR